MYDADGSSHLRAFVQSLTASHPSRPKTQDSLKCTRHNHRWFWQETLTSDILLYEPKIETSRAKVKTHIIWLSGSLTSAQQLLYFFLYFSLCISLILLNFSFIFLLLYYCFAMERDHRPHDLSFQLSAPNSHQKTCKSQQTYTPVYKLAVVHLKVFCQPPINHK